MLRTLIIALFFSLSSVTFAASDNTCEDYLRHGKPSAQLVDLGYNLKVFEYLATLIVAKKLRDGAYWEFYSLMRQDRAGHQGQLFAENKITYDLTRRSLKYFETEIDLIFQGKSSNTLLLSESIASAFSPYGKMHSYMWQNQEAKNKVFQYLTDNIESIIMNAQNIPNITTKERIKYSLLSRRPLIGYIPSPRYESFYPGHVNNSKYAREIGRLFLIF